MLDTDSPGGGIYQYPLQIQINSNYMYKKTTHPINKKQIKLNLLKNLEKAKKIRTHVISGGWRRNQCISY